MAGSGGVDKRRGGGQGKELTAEVCCLVQGVRLLEEQGVDSGRQLGWLEVISCKLKGTC